MKHDVLTNNNKINNEEQDTSKTGIQKILIKTAKFREQKQYCKKINMFSLQFMDP